MPCSVTIEDVPEPVSMRLTPALPDGGPLLELDAVFRATTPPLLQEMTVVPPGIHLSHFAVSPSILQGHEIRDDIIYAQYTDEIMNPVRQSEEVPGVPGGPYEYSIYGIFHRVLCGAAVRSSSR
ncbi:hypothetical protein DFH09DRAFT_1072392 [Mycena vulgaris]|nr:hypothetical protein DFH09DRAFT_1072392 [Mycena vulgaris]